MPFCPMCVVLCGPHLCFYYVCPLPKTCMCNETCFLCIGFRWSWGLDVVFGHFPLSFDCGVIFFFGQCCLQSHVFSHFAKCAYGQIHDKLACICILCGAYRVALGFGPSASM